MQCQMTLLGKADCNEAVARAHKGIGTFAGEVPVTDTWSASGCDKHADRAVNDIKWLNGCDEHADYLPGCAYTQPAVLVNTPGCLPGHMVDVEAAS
jgi:hypothetical protein